MDLRLSSLTEFGYYAPEFVFLTNLSISVREQCFQYHWKEENKSIWRKAIIRECKKQSTKKMEIRNQKKRVKEVLIERYLKWLVNEMNTRCLKNTNQYMKNILPKK